MYVFESRPTTEEHKISKTKVIFEIPDGKRNVEDLLIEFRAFLLACGFEVPGEIVIQKEDTTPSADI